MRFPSSLLNQYSQDRAPGRSETLTTVTAGDATAYKHDFAPRSQKYLPDQACWAKTIATKWQQELDKAKTDKDNTTELYMFSEAARVEAECQWKKTSESESPRLKQRRNPPPKFSQHAAQVRQMNLATLRS